jgi:23S rRNA pseudouridine955/2504/2580 synthase/23S rRNA pseudouridine1911/1915/1917 synthase
MINPASLILAETTDWVALNKPAGLLSIPDREGKEISLKQLLVEQYGSILTVHRLDRDTSGLILFARTEKAHQLLSRQFENRETEKIYQGLVSGVPMQTEGRIEAPIAPDPAVAGKMRVHRAGKDSLTGYRLLEALGPCSWMEFNLYTGRTHQIRVHLQHLGHPLLCDPLYGDGKPFLLSSVKSRYKLSRHEEEERPLLARLALHAARLRFAWEGRPVELEAPLPRDLRAVLQQLGKQKKARTGPR